MELSRRITGINAGGSDGWEVFYRARRMAAEGRPVIELTIGEHDERTPETILDAMQRSARGGHTGYAAVPGIHALRAAVAARVAERTGVPTTPDNVLITPGGQAGLFAAHMALCDPGDTALFIDPYYVTYPGTIRAAGALPKPVITRPEDGFLPDPEALAAAAGGARTLLINTPNNPTGGVYPEATLRGIAAVCRESDLWLVSDEVYDTQVWEGRHLSPRALPGMRARTLVIGSMSKSHAMTGSRIGWIIGPEEAIGHLIALSTSTTYGVAGFVQDAAHFALAEGRWLEEAVAAPFRRRRSLAARVFAGQNRLRLLPPMGAMYLMLDVRETGLSGIGFAERLLDEAGIAVMPGESFGSAAAGHVRVAMTAPDPAFTVALERIVHFADALG